MHTHIELRGREMMKTKKNLQAVYFFMCMKVHWWNFQRNPTPNNDINEKKRWCQSPSAAACHQLETHKSTQLQPTKPANWKHIHPTEKTLKKSVDFFSLKITESTNHPNKKSVNFLPPGNLWKHNQSPNWKNCELFCLLEFTESTINHPTEKTMNFVLLCCFWVTKIRAQVSSVGCSSSFKVFI
jgi:hypothetical protein